MDLTMLKLIMLSAMFLSICFKEELISLLSLASGTSHTPWLVAPLSFKAISVWSMPSHDAIFFCFYFSALPSPTFKDPCHYIVPT